MYRIKLISVSNNELKNETLNVYLKNDYYFSKISDTPPTISNVEEDIEIVPDGVQKNQKNYKLISFNDEILGVVDYLTDYPEKNSFKDKNFLKIRIGVLVDNKIGLSFWKKQNFKEIERKFLKFEKSEKEVIVMEKEI